MADSKQRVREEMHTAINGRLDAISSISSAMQRIPAALGRSALAGPSRPHPLSGSRPLVSTWGEGRLGPFFPCVSLAFPRAAVARSPGPGCPPGVRLCLPATVRARSGQLRRHRARLSRGARSACFALAASPIQGLPPVGAAAPFCSVSVASLAWLGSA